MATHWHDTPLFEQIRDQRVAASAATDDDEAEMICRHGGLDYFMQAPNSGAGWFLCKRCCVRNVEIELLALKEPPAAAAG